MMKRYGCTCGCGGECDAPPIQRAPFWLRLVGSGIVGLVVRAFRRRKVESDPMLAMMPVPRSSARISVGSRARFTINVVGADITDEQIRRFRDVWETVQRKAKPLGEIKIVD